MRFESLEDRRLLAVLTVDSLADNTFGDNLTTLREAIATANSIGGADTIVFDSNLAGGKIDLVLGQLGITHNLTIDASALPGGIVIDAQNNSRVMNFDHPTGGLSGESLTLSGLTLQNGQTTGSNSPAGQYLYSGGGIRFRSFGALTLTGSTVKDSGSSTLGGGIFALDDVVLTGSTVTGNSSGSSNSGGGIFTFGTATLNNSTVSDNTAGGAGGGGGIFATYDVTLTSSTVSGNTGNDGGGIVTIAGNVTLSNSSVSGNTANDRAGGIFADSGEVTLNDSTVSDNMASGRGGGIYSISGGVTLNDSTVSGNSGISAGGIFSFSGDVTLNDGTVSNNTAVGFAGGIRLISGNLALNSSTVSDNTADNNGGGIFADTGNVTLTSSTVSGNMSENSGAGIYAKANAVVILSSSTVSGNSSTFDAGGIFADTGSVTLTDSTLSGNSSNGFGGGIGTNSAAIVVTGSTLSGNSSQTGGGIFTDTGAVTINNSTVTENTANVVGGVVIADGPQNPPLTIQNSIIAGNTSPTRPFDLTFDPDGVIDIDYSLIGDTLSALLPEAQTPDANGNLVGNFLGGGIIDPLLGPLADNGGLTQTHAPLPGSPAINAGDPLVALNFSELDQRGFLRVIDGRVDMGAVESPLATPEQSLVVTIAADLENPFDGFTSLRDAINFANSLPGDATITFDASLSGAEIDLTEGELLISDTVTIDAGLLVDNVTIDAQQQSRVINFNAAGFDLTLVGLNLQNGMVDGNGGGIRFADGETLSLTRSSVSGNSTSGANADGGGIYTFSGDVLIRDSTVSGNGTDGNLARGGGIFAQQGTLRVTNSTISGNTTVGATADGGGIYMGSGTLRINNSTVTKNTAAGAGAIYFGNRAYLDNSIVAGNSGNGVPSNIAGSGPILGGNYNLLGDGLAPGTSTNITGVNDPLLAALADNGGQTQTHALLPSSPAINAGDPNFNPNNFLPPLVNDQRGMPRVDNGRIDIGAFETQAVQLVVNSTDDVDDGDINNGLTTLREAINFVNSNPGADSITFDASLSGGEIDLAGGELAITDTLIIDASSLASNVMIDAGQLSRVINFSTISGSGDLALSGLTLLNGLTTAVVSFGGGIRFSSSGTLTLTDSILSGSGTTGFGSKGGGIYTNFGSVALIASTLSDNSTSGSYAHGGGLFNSSGTVTLTSSTVSGNSTSNGGSKGGGIYVKSGEVTLISSTVSGNSTIGASA